MSGSPAQPVKGPVDFSSRERAEPRIGLAFLIACLLPSPVLAQGAVPQAIAGYEATCLKTAPSFSGVFAAARAAGFQKDNGTLILGDGSARIDVFLTEQGCACMTSLIAPDPNATAKAVLDVTLPKTKSYSDHPNREIAAVLVWKDGDNALQLESDTRGQIPMVKATLLSRTLCPTD